MAYRRNRVAGATYFLTFCLQNRQRTLLTDYIVELRIAYQQLQQKMPFITEAIVIMPEHIHALWTVPEYDDDYSNRIRLLKTYFSKQLPKQLITPANQSQHKKGERGIWQRRFYEHTIRNEADFNRHLDYIHYNPVKHGYVHQVKDWKYSTFYRYVKQGVYPIDWGGSNEDVSMVDFGE